MKTFPMRARIRNEGDGPARVDIFDDIGQDFWGGGVSAQDFAAQLAGVRGPLDVHINSYGGDVFAGQTMAEAIRNHNGPVTTKVDGIAASIASVIAQAGTVREMAPGAILMIHDAWSFAEGNAANMRSEADKLDKVSDVLAGEYARRAGGTVGQWRDVMRSEAWYDAQEALEAGLADKVGGGAAQRPASVDVEQLAARAPGRIMAALRAMPQAAEGGEGGKPRAAAGTPYEPQPYQRTPDENVQCPECQKFSDCDARFCGQCGTQLLGRSDVQEAALAPVPAGDLGYPPGNPGGGDPGWPGSLDLAAVRTVIREELVAASLLPGGGLSPLLGAKVDESPWDASKAWAAGAASDDPAAFYKGICAGEKADGDPATQGHWALPYKYAPGDPPNAAGVKAALSALPKTQALTNEAEAKKTLQAAMKQVNPDYEPEDSTDKTIFSLRLEQMRGAMPSLKGADA